VCLLGQNVNGFHDTSEDSSIKYPSSAYKAADGFSNIYRGKKRDAPGARFADLLEMVAGTSTSTSKSKSKFQFDELSKGYISILVVSYFM